MYKLTILYKTVSFQQQYVLFHSERVDCDQHEFTWRHGVAIVFIVKASLSKREASMSIIRRPVCVHVWERQKQNCPKRKKEMISPAWAPHSSMFTPGCECISVCGALATAQACAAEFRVATLRLIWAKPVFVTYRITHLGENAIYVKHAGNGEKGNKRAGPPEKVEPRGMRLSGIR